MSRPPHRLPIPYGVMKLLVGYVATAQGATPTDRLRDAVARCRCRELVDQADAMRWETMGHLLAECADDPALLRAVTP